jgi:hypothetical protein
MPRRIARLFFRVAGWLLTPLVLVCAAAIGATIGLMVAPTLSPNAGLGLTAGMSLVAAIAGLVLWIRLLRQHPRLRHTLEMTVEGVPESSLVERLIHPDEAGRDGPA